MVVEPLNRRIAAVGEIPVGKPSAINNHKLAVGNKTPGGLFQMGICQVIFKAFIIPGVPP